MSCTGCSNDTSAGTSAARTAFDAAFGRFWPAGLLGPRLLPWVGAALSRDDARAWALAIGADRDPGVLAGDEQAMLHLIGLAMAGGGVYAEERKGRKKKTRPVLPTGCSYTADCGGGYQTVVCADCLGAYCDGKEYRCWGPDAGSSGPGEPGGPGTDTSPGE